MIDVDGYEDAAATLCQCPALSKVNDCATFAGGRLDAALDDAREKWLERFISKKCNEECTRAVECFDAAPVCSGEGSSCLTSVECCGYSRGKGCCANAGDSTCCDDCLTCGELFGEGETPQVPLCVDSLKIVEGLVDCLCTACEVACAAYCPGELGNGDPLCNGCIVQETKVTGACYSAIAACAADLPPG